MAPKTFAYAFFVLFFLHGRCKADTKAPPHFHAIFFFGDSTVDTGNNNYIPSLLQANHHPYGIEFPGHMATGRFSSGRLVPDFLASYLGIKEVVPPFLDPKLTDEDLKTGVSFASGGSGYDRLTSIGQVIPMDRQIEYFQAYKQRLEQIVGTKTANQIIKGALFVISAGTNDFCLNFYDLITRRLQFDINGYQDYLLNQLRTHVQELYNMGVRTFVVAGVPPVGCIPFQMTVQFRSPIKRICLDDENNDSQVYNRKLVILLSQMQNSLPGTKFEYADIYNPTFDMVMNPQKYGFTVVDRGCCGIGFVEAAILCSNFSPVCQNPTKSLFWDAIHPGQTAYSYLSQALQQSLFPKLVVNQTKH